MSVTVLLSAGRHPVSGAPALPRLEAQMVRLARGLGPVRGLHAGPSAEPAREALGHGLALVEHLRIAADADPIPVLAAALSRSRPSLVLAGRLSQGQDETGLVPYALAQALSMPIIADAIAVTRGAEPDTIVVDQALPRGARRRMTVRLPAVVTIHPGAPPPLPFAFGQARRGRVETVDEPESLPGAPALVSCEERAFRARPKVMRGAPTGSAMERLEAATGASGGGKANVLVDPDPDVAAREILAHLRRIGVLRPTPGATSR